jgi:hypothetical protein
VFVCESVCESVSVCAFGGVCQIYSYTIPETRSGWLAKLMTESK